MYILLFIVINTFPCTFILSMNILYIFVFHTCTCSITLLNIAHLCERPQTLHVHTCTACKLEKKFDLLNFFTNIWKEFILLTHQVIKMYIYMYKYKLCINPFTFCIKCTFLKCTCTYTQNIHSANLFMYNVQVFYTHL